MLFLIATFATAIVAIFAWVLVTVIPVLIALGCFLILLFFITVWIRSHRRRVHHRGPP